MVLLMMEVTGFNGVAVREDISSTCDVAMEGSGYVNVAAKELYSELQCV